MNQPSDTSRETDSIKSEIDTTRERMDDTIDALADRLQPRHLVDEAIGFFRSKTSDTDISSYKEKMSSAVGTAASSVVNTVKRNPIPTLVIGAGIAWLIYSTTKKSNDRDTEHWDRELPYDDDLGYETPYDPASDDDYTSPGASYTPSGSAPSAEDVKSNLGQKASDLKSRVQDKASQVSDQAKQGLRTARDRAGQITSRVQDRAKQVYDQGRQKVSQTADEYPLGLGLGCLAVGVVAGLLIPTPDKVNEVAGPTVDRVKRRAREASRNLVDRGRHVVEAAASAVKEEAKAQGLTPDALKQKAGAVAGKAKQAASDTAQNEGIAPSSVPGGSSGPSGAGGQDQTSSASGAQTPPPSF